MATDDPDPHRREEPPPDCLNCGARMALASTVPKPGDRPELRTFTCEVCGEVVTEEAKSED